MFRFDCHDRFNTALLFPFLAAALTLFGSLFMGTQQAEAGENMLLRHIAGDMPSKGSGKKFTSKYGKEKHKEVSGMREMKAGHGLKRLGTEKSKHPGSKRNKKHRDVVKTVGYVSGGSSARYGSAKRRHAANSRTTIRAGKSKVVQGRYGRASGSSKSSGGFSNSGMIIVSINNSSNTNGMQEIGGGDRQSAGAGLADCAYRSYCTIELGGPKIITFNDVGDIGKGGLIEEDLDVPDPDIVYAK